ncbi:MAG TPA: glycosyltransferase, partial [Blastocatellia bacterium]|nr:glycosyltransferase [Blastocatellia bacterium]
MRLGIDASNIRSGGGLTYLLEILRAAEPQDCGITQIVIWAGQETLDQLPARPWLQIRHEALLDQSLPARIYWQYFKLPRLAEESCDCLFVPGGSHSGSFRPFVGVSSNMLPFEPAELKRYGLSWMNLKLRLLRFSQTRGFRRADGIIFLTEYARATVTEAVQVDGWHPVIPFGINKQFYLEPRPSRPIGACTPKEPFRLLYVSKIEPYKHQWSLVEAVARLRGEGLPLALDLIGGPENSAAWRELVRVLGQVDPGAEFIHYLDHIPYRELPNYYHRADAFVFASSCENLPNILLEAMAAGLPIICSN